MRVLLSIKPEHVENIFNGSKKFEFRRRIFGRKDVNVVVVYATKPVGKIVGEFDLDDVLADTPDTIWHVTSSASGISKSYFDDYFGGRDRAFALKIGEVRRYDQPVEPYEVIQNFTPPQSYMYVCNLSALNGASSDQFELFAAE